MADAATTAVRTVAVYCGAGHPVRVPLVLPMMVEALGEVIVNKLRSEGHSVSASRMVLWRVSSHDDLDALQAGADAAARLNPALKLKAWDTIDTFTADHRIWVQLLGDGTGAPSAVAAAGGAGAGAVAAAPGAYPTLAELMTKVNKLEAQQAAVDAELLPMLQKGLFTVLDKGGHPTCCGFFVRESGVALTVNHGKKDWLLPGNVVRAVMLRDMATYGTAATAAAAAAAAADDGGTAAAAAAAAAPAAGDGGIALPDAGDGGIALPDEVLLRFKVHSYSEEDDLDYTCLTLTSPVPPGTFHPLPLPPVGLSIDKLIGAHATLLHGSIALNRHFKQQPSASLFPCTIFTAHADRVLYTAATAGGDSGGALVLHGKVLVAMHAEGLNDVGDTEVMSPTEGKGRRAKRMRLSEASPSTTGAALRLDLREVQEAIAMADQHMQQVLAVAAGASAGGKA